MRQEFHSRVDQVNIGEVHHHHWPEAVPPDDPEKSMQCPQCGRLTWRHSRHCIHCQLDLRSWSLRKGLASLMRSLTDGLRVCRKLISYTS